MDRAITALKNNEEDIVLRFSGDPKDFIRKCTELGIFSREIGGLIRKSFEALDSNVPRDVSIRYLLVHAYDGLRGNQRLFEPFLKVLAYCGVSDHVLLRIKATQGSPSPIFMETMSLADDIGDALSTCSTEKVVVGAKRPRDRRNHFLEEHIPALTEILDSQSSKWQNIGMSLNLPSKVLEDILALFHAGQDSRMCLSTLLEQWIAQTYQHAKSPTIDHLKAALRSQIVGLGSVANQLDDELIKHGICFDEEETSPLVKRYAIAPTSESLQSQIVSLTSVSSQKRGIKNEGPSSLAKRPRLDASLLDIVSQTLDTCVNEDKSTLLEVQVEASHGTTISYQWLKDYFPLEEGEDFIGINKPVLCINNGYIAKGAYVCKITFEDDLIPTAPVCSEHINVSVSVSPLKKVLMDRYCAQPEIPEDSWPPRSGNTYINLALIKQGSIEKAGEYACNTIQGDMDDIFSNKESIEYENVFTNLESGTRLLIEGRPGSGKTTLVHMFSRDWGRGKLQLKNIKLVFLVHLRGFFNDSKIGLRDIVQQYYTHEGKHMVEHILEYSVDRNGEGLCFILDGLDDYNPVSKGQTFIFKLIKQDLLPKSIVIVASRPAATAKLKNIATRQVEVIGFLKHQINEYIEKYSFSDFCRREDLHEYLEQHPNVRHMCYLPIHAAMVCYLFDVMGSKLPRTETKMYTEFTNHTLLRYLTRCEKELDYNLESLDDLQGQDKEIFDKICKLAFEMTATSRQAFRNASIGSETMGLITIDQIASICGFDKLYTFLHLTFQEYLAAYHISKLEEEKQLEVIDQYSQKKHMIVVWKFYCGLVNFNEQEQKLRKIMSLKDDLFNVHCAFESQQTVTCNSVVMTGETGTLSFKNHFLTPSDSTAIGYVVKNAECLVEKVVLNRCKLSKKGIDALIDEAGDKISSLKALSFHGKDCLTMEQFKLLNTCLHFMKSLEVFDISHTNLGPRKMKLLTENLTLPNLQTLKLSSSMLHNDLQPLLFGSPTFRQVLLVDGDIHQHRDSIVSCFGFSTFLSSCGSQARIRFQDHPLKLSELKVLSNSISHFSCCTNLCLTNCNIGDNVGVLKSLALLESFDVSVNGISGSGATAVADNIKHFTKIQNLNMSFNHIGDSGAIALAESLPLLINLKKLDLSYNLIGDKGAIAVTRATKDLQVFELLLWNHKITEEGVGTVINMKPNTELNIHVLNLMGMSVAMLDTLAANIDGETDQLGKIQVVNFKGLRKQEVILRVLSVLKQYMNLEAVNLEGYNFLSFVDSIKHCTELQSLHLEGSNIGDTGAQTLANLIEHNPNLLTLDLGSNSIGPCGAKALADGLMHCTNLQLLYLSKNSIGSRDTDGLIASADGINALIYGLKHCTKLQTLNLDVNCIDNDGAVALAYNLKHHTNLQTLNLGLNSIGTGGARALTDGLKNCTNLQTLVFDSNCFGADGAKALADCLQHYTNLQTLHLDHNGIGNDGAIALADGLQYCTNLQTLHLDGNEICAEGAKALADGLKHCTNLQTLHFDLNKIGSDGAKALADCLKHWTNLQTLNLNWNEICADGAKALADGLKHCTNLQALHLDLNNIGSDGAKVLADGLKHCTNLQALHLVLNNIGADGAKPLADGLKDCTNLQTLDLNWNGLCDDGAKALANSLKHCTNLQTLHLDGNEICADGAKALADGLKHYTNLETLHLNSNKIACEGAKPLADCLKHCTNLQTLHLNWNEICADGAKALADGFKHYTNLRTLHLDGNKICADGAMALAGGLKYCTNLQTLHLDRNEICAEGTKALADGLKHCTNLQVLHLNSNKISSDGAKGLADCLKHCTNLQTLDLNWNGICDDGAKALADSLKHCTNLQTLHLDGNKICADGAKALADSLQHCTNLQTLHLDGNEICAEGAKPLADSLKHYTNLQTLHLNSNKIGSDGAKALADCLKHCTNLQTLDLNWNGICDNGAKALANGLKHCTNLQTLHLDRNEICADSAKALADGLKHCTNLQTLHLDGNNVGSDGVKTLADGLKHCTNLQALHFNSNKIGSDGAMALADGLKHCTNLQILHFDGNEICAEGAKALADGLKHCTNLQTLHLGGNEICAEGAKALADSLKHCTNLQTLYLNTNKIGSDGAKALADCLKHCTNLQTLDLNWNGICDDGAKALANGLKHCTNLQTLDLNWNGICDDGANALANGLKHCTNLQTLHLDGNEICAEGAKALADSLKHCTNLQTLDLNWNGICDDGAKALANSLKHCTNLQTLHLDGNEICAEGAKALADSLKHCTNLQTLHLNSNKIGSDGAKALADCLKHCTNLQTLHLDRNEICAEGAKALADCLKHCTNLQTLHLNSNKIGSYGAKALANGLKHCTNLQTLDLNWNGICDDGAKVLANGLKHCTNLQTLDLNWNGICADGAKALADGLKHYTNLRTLHLDGNKICADGAMGLADGLKHCTNLQTLHLDRNEICADGAKALADGLKHCTNLQTLHLNSNKISSDGTMALADGLKHCTHLQTLHLNSNKISSDDAKALADGLKHCTHLQTLHLGGNEFYEGEIESPTHCSYLAPADTFERHDGIAGHDVIQETPYQTSSKSILVSGTFEDVLVLADSDNDVVIPDETPRTTCLLIMDSKTIEQTYSWDDAGFRLYLPEGPLPDEVNGKTIKLEATISGSYHFPPNTEPVSAIYSIATDLSIEATLELEHCYRGNKKDLAFVYCQSRQPPFDFILATKENYKYSFTANNGVIKTQHFSHWAIVVLVDWFDKARSWVGFRDDIILNIIPFYQVEVSHVKVDLVIVRGLSAHVKVRGHESDTSNA